MITYTRNNAGDPVLLLPYATQSQLDHALDGLRKDRGNTQGRWFIADHGGEGFTGYRTEAAAMDSSSCWFEVVL